jgi:hypothetical protein
MFIVENNKAINWKNWEDYMEILGTTPPVHKQLTKVEFEQREFEKYMDEEVQVKVKISRRNLEKFIALKDYEEYEKGIEIPTKYFIGDLIDNLVKEKMDYFNLIQSIADGDSSEIELREKYGSRDLRLIPSEANFRNAIRKINGLERE